MKKILIVDDEKSVCETLRILLKDHYQIITANNGQRAMELLEEEPDLMILDVIMPDMDGLEVLKKVRSVNQELPIIMLSAVDRIKTVVEAIKLGAIEYITKPFDNEELKHTIERMLDVQKLRSELAYLKRLNRDYQSNDFVGESPAAKRIINEVELVARTDSSVLIRGESGVGKEVVARLIHQRSPRQGSPFVAVHCAALPENLFESELFGHEKGAFTDASARKPGMFDIVRDGTLFLDEVGDMPLTTQVKLLRVLQEKEFFRLGGTRLVRTEARVLAATSKNLEEEIGRRTFREDFYYRLNVVTIRIPPLRERRDDIPRLIDHFFNQLRQSLHTETAAISDGVKKQLQDYDWPGNVRELKNIVERLLVLHADVPVLQPAHLEGILNNPAANPKLQPENKSLEEALQEYEKFLIGEAIKKSGGVKSRAAEILRTTRRILSYRMEKLGLSNGSGSS
ncbi:MAG TPA: sigma-54 dependent transcriptional regulator [bacterium]|nr:sigma-54 dependent transcriptional regulator [bacterium]